MKNLTSIKNATSLTISLAMLFLFGIAKANDEVYTISGIVTGCSSKNPIHVLLYNEVVFKDMAHIQENIYQPDKSQECYVPYMLEVQKGSYVVAAFEDKNKNNKLDFFFFIPKEPSGFFRKFSGISAPKFEKLKFDVDGNVVGANVELQ